MPNEPAARLIEVTKRIGSRTIIDRLSLDIMPGEVLGFLGPNGSGKTTTIRMMTGLMGMTSGDVVISGWSVRREFSRAMAHVGAIVENPEMYHYLTGYQNLLHFARMYPSVDRQRIIEVVRLVGLEARIRDKVSSYSLGMRQRLGVAQAIMHRPKLLVLDEPTNGLDPSGIRQLRDHLRRLAREEGTAVLVSSHLLAEMELMCDRVAILQNGRIADIRTLRQGDDPDAANTEEKVLFIVDDTETALRALDGFGQGTAAHGGILIHTNRKGVAEANRRLVEAGVPVYGIRPQTKSLEDQFLEVTGSGQIG